MRLEEIEGLIGQLSELSTDLYQNDFLLTWQRSSDELQAVLLAAEVLEGLWSANIRARVFDGGLAVSHFRDQSTRTRFSFAGAANLLGLGVQDLDEGKSQIAHGETVRETANMISFLTEVIGIRDDIFLGRGHAHMAEVSAAVEDGYREGVLPQRPAVINLQCDLDHPTQSMADLLHLKQTFGSMSELAGKKLVMSWAYSPSYGKPLSVPQGIIALMSRFGMNVVLANPPGYDLVPETVSDATRFAGESGGSFQCTSDMKEAFADADIVYPKSWASFDVMRRRTELLTMGNTDKLAELERECLAENKQHTSWECNEDMMKLTRGDDAVYMHCLPADITNVSCEAGEVSARVFERARLTTYREAGHKPFIIAAMILLTRFENVAGVFRGLISGGHARRYQE